MQLIIISDSHDNIVRLRHVMGFGEASKAGAIIHCGDWNTPLAVKQFSRVKTPVFGVLGNADIDPRMPESLKDANIQFDLDFLKLNLDNRLIGISHYPPSLSDSSGQAFKKALASGEYDLLVYGHTHRSQQKRYGSTLLVNPGALHNTPQPSFAVYDTETANVELIDVVV